MRFVEHSDDAAAATNRLVAGDFGDVETLIHDADVAVEDVVWRRFVGVFVEDVPREASRQKTRYIGVVLACTRLAAFNRHPRLRVGARHVGREIQVQDFVGEWAFVGGGDRRPYAEDLERASPIQGKLYLEDGGVSIRRCSGSSFGALSGCRSRVVDPNPTASFVLRCFVEGVCK